MEWQTVVLIIAGGWLALNVLGLIVWVIVVNKFRKDF